MTARPVINELPKLHDVDVTSPADGDALVYDSAAAKWKNTSGGSLAPLSRPRPQLSGDTILTRFDTGHGWTFTQSTGSVSDDSTTPGPFAATSSVLMDSGASGAPEVGKSGLTVADLASNVLILWVKWDVAPNDELFVYAGDSTFTNFYLWDRVGRDGSGGVQAQGNNDDGWTAYALMLQDASATGTLATNAITRIKVRAVSSGGNKSRFWLGGFATRPLPTDVYPNGVISITFDDGLASAYTQAMPALAQFGYPATAFMIVDQIGNSGYMTLEQVVNLHERAGWEIAAHAYTNAAHQAGFTTLSNGQMTAEFQGLRRWLRDNGFRSDNWASPHGLSNAAVWAVARQYFSTHRGVGGAGGALNRIGQIQTARPVYPPWLFSGSFASAGSYSVTDVQAVITKVAASKGWGILTFHAVQTAASSGETISVTDLNTILSSIQSSGVAVETMQRVLEKTY